MLTITYTLDTLSRLKGIETKSVDWQETGGEYPLDTLSRLKGIETFIAYPETERLNNKLWIRFPV